MLRRMPSRPGSQGSAGPATPPARAPRWLWLVLAAATAVLAVALLASGGSGRRRPRPGPRVAPAAAGAVAAGALRSGARPAHADAAIRRVLRRASYVAAGTRRRRDIALTFDDGPGPFTGQILTILERHRVPATFFVIGRQAGLFPRLVSRERRDGATIGDHTEGHPALAALSEGAQDAQIGVGAAHIEAAGGPSPVLFRPPYGSFNAATLKILRRRRMLMVLWSVDTRDYARPGSKRIAYVALSGAIGGAIVLMHDGGGPRQQTVAALPRIIRGLRRRGFHLVTVPQLVRDDPPPRRQPPAQNMVGG